MGESGRPKSAHGLQGHSQRYSINFAVLTVSSHDAFFSHTYTSRPIDVIVKDGQGHPGLYYMEFRGPCSAGD